MNPGDSRKRIKDFEKVVLAELLAQCTEKQREFFNKIFPNGVSEKDMKNAIDLCERTVISNQKASINNK